MVRISFLTCVFLIGLRLVIGWHFFFEGLNKYESVQRGKSEISRPFTSAGYLAEAEGPLGPRAREELGDVDANVLAKLKLADSGDDRPLTKMPAALAKEWDNYARQFEAFYKLNDDQKRTVDKNLDQAKTNFVLWLTDEMPKPKEGKEKKKEDEPKKIKKTVTSVGAPLTYEVEDKVQERVLLYQLKVKAIRAVFERRLPAFGRDVEKGHLRTLKGEAAAMRLELQKDVDDHTKKMKESLAKVVSDQLAGVDLGVPEDPAIDDRVLALLTLEGVGDEATVERMPTPLDRQWNDYLSYVKEHGRDELRKDPQRGDEMLADAKLRYVRFLLDRDQFSGAPLAEKEVAWRLKEYGDAVAAYREAQAKLKQQPTKENEAAVAAAAKRPASLRQSFSDDIKRHTEILRQNLSGFKAEKDEDKDYDNFKGTIQPEKEKTRFLWRDWPTTKLEWLDWSTRWLLLVAGGCLLLGLFSRLASLACVTFLVFEYLLNSPFPWLPTSPKAEGNYFFVNKNVVELMALLVLATVPTGRWFGLDAILSRIWPFRSKNAKTR